MAKSSRPTKKQRRNVGGSSRHRNPCVTAWRFIKSALTEAGVVGRLASPRGLRHGFAVTALQASVPLNLVQRWLGHARIATTAIYTSACGDEEAAFAARLWHA